MAKKIIEKIKNINKLSKSIIKYGSIISLILILAGFYMLCTSNNHTNYFVSQEFIKSSFMVWAEVIISGLFIDLIT